MFVACGIWCLADVSSVSPSSESLLVGESALSSVSPSSESLLRRRVNARNVS